MLLSYVCLDQSCMMLRSSNLGASKTSYQSSAYAAAVACAMLPTLIKQYNSESSKQAMRDFHPRNRVTPPAYFNLVIFHVRLLLKSLVKISFLSSRSSSEITEQ